MLGEGVGGGGGGGDDVIPVPHGIIQKVNNSIKKREKNFNA